MISAMTPSTTGRTTFVLVFRPEPECADPIRALRWLLKAALRQHGLKCVSAHQNKERQP